MKIGDEVYVHGYVDEIRNDVVIIRNEGGYFGTVPSEITADRKTEPQAERGKLINAVVKLDMSREDKFKVIELLEQHCEKCKHYLFTDIDGYYCEHETYGQPCHYEPKDEPQTERSE